MLSWLTAPQNNTLPGFKWGTSRVDTLNVLLKGGGKLTCSKINANICRFLLSACTPLFLPQTFGLLKLQADKQHSYLKFMKHLFNSPGWDLSWQPFYFSRSCSASLTFIRTALDMICGPWQITPMHHPHCSPGSKQRTLAPVALTTADTDKGSGKSRRRSVLYAAPKTIAQ